MVQIRKCSYQRNTHSQIQPDGNTHGNTIQMNVIEHANSENITNNNNEIMSIVNNPMMTQQSQIQQQFEEALTNPINLEWINKEWIQQVVRTCALFSFISICANTPETFKNYKLVMILTYVTDLICTLVFTIEMIAKIKIKGLFRGESAYIFDRWCQFDGIMVIFHIISVVLQVKLLIISYLKLTNQ